MRALCNHNREAGSSQYGGTVQRSGQPYDGGELVVVIDCARLERAAEFWCAVLGYRPEDANGAADAEDRRYLSLVPRGGAGIEVLLQRVDDAKLAKNRLHFDLRTADLDVEVARAVGAGATRVTGAPIEEYGWRWHVLLDPDANEFCILQPPGSMRQVPDAPGEPPEDVDIRAMTEDDLPAVRAIYAAGIATGNATFETAVPSADALLDKWIPGHRWVATIGSTVVGWAAISPVSARACYAGVGETSVYVTASVRGRGVGRALVRRQVTEADRAGLWTLQTSIFPENQASLRLHHGAGFKTVGVRERIAQQHGVWRDTVFLERRSQTDDPASSKGVAAS